MCATYVESVGGEMKSYGYKNWKITQTNISYVAIASENMFLPFSVIAHKRTFHMVNSSNLCGPLGVSFQCSECESTHSLRTIINASCVPLPTSHLVPCAKNMPFVVQSEISVNQFSSLPSQRSSKKAGSMEGEIILQTPPSFTIRNLCRVSEHGETIKHDQVLQIFVT